MKSMIDAKSAIERFEQAKTEFEEAFEPYVKMWLDIQVSLGKLTPSEAEQTFRYESMDSDGAWFESDSWEETWQYGGYERHSGRDIKIPFEFFEDSQKFTTEAEAKKAALDKIRAQQEKARRLQAVKEAEAALAYAKSNLKGSK
jgi:hypothetical protein